MKHYTECTPALERTFTDDDNESKSDVGWYDRTSAFTFNDGWIGMSARGSEVELTIRETRIADVEDLFLLRAQTRDNSISKEQLAKLGITPDSVAGHLALGRVKGYLCTHGSDVVGFCNGDQNSGEILVLAVLPQFEGNGIGRNLLMRVVTQLRAIGCTDLWLAASPDSSTRAHGFYRSLGWRSNGKMDKKGDEILVLPDTTSDASSFA